MSTQDRESFYEKLLQASVFQDIQSLSGLFANDSFRTPEKFNWILEKAIKNKDTKIIDFLFSSGVRIDVLNDTKQTAIHLAVHYDFPEIVDLLFEHCDGNMNFCDNDGLTHFHIACITGNTTIARNFLQNGTDVNAVVKSSLFTPLHFAVEYRRVSIVELLLQHGANPNVPDHFNRISLHLICRGTSGTTKKLETISDERRNEDELSIVELLVKYGSDVNAKDCSGDTPLTVIFQDDYPDLVASRMFSDVNEKHKIIQEFRNAQKKKINFLIQNKADVRVCNDKGETALHLAIGDMKRSRRPRVLSDAQCIDDTVNVEMIEILLKREARVNAKDKKNETPLQIAVSLLSLDAVKLLLNYNADVKRIRFDDDRFYYCENILPCLETTENLIGIVKMLRNRGFQLTRKDNLAILRFFVCHNVDCLYADPKDENAAYKLKNLLELGVAANIENSLNKFPVNLDDSSYLEQYARKQVIYQIQRHLTILEIGGFYLSKDTQDCLKQKISSLQKHLLGCLSHTDRSKNINLDIVMEEVQSMKSTLLTRNLSLHDVLRQNPRSVHLQARDFTSILKSRDFAERFPRCVGIARGHLAKALVRRYVVRSAQECLRSLTADARLPEVCCEMICGYLSNETLLDVCVAASRGD